VNPLDSSGRPVGGFNRGSNSEASKQIHKYDDVDFDIKSHHHTIGDGPYQVPSGAEFRAFKNLYDNEWEAPTLAAGWTDVGFGNMGSGIKLEGGDVKFKGHIVTAGAYAAYTTIFSLPGYAPSLNQVIVCTYSNGAGTAFVLAPIQVTNLGDVKCTVAIPAGNILYLSGSCPVDA
jgi:hypothetical protein